MKDESRQWFKYARENLESAEILYERDLFNPCLQNAQQCVEKSLKAVFIERQIKLKRTHSILELKRILQQNNIQIELSDNECDFLDSIYLPSKYPLGSVLPDFEPDSDICAKGVAIARKVVLQTEILLSK